MNSLDKAILATLAYFDIFDYPLTSYEIWKWLFVQDGELRTIKYADIHIALTEGVLKEKVYSRRGYYFLSGREKITDVRQARYLLAEKKFQKAKKIIKLLRFIPYIKMIAVCNTLAINNSREEADIDLFIVTSSGRVWQSRFWVAGLLDILKQRPSQLKTKDTICSTFFVDDQNLNLKKISIDGDIYLPYWISQLVPVYDQGAYDKFIDANQWVREKLPNIIWQKLASRKKVRHIPGLKYFLALILSILPESLFKNYQLKIMPEKLRTMANQDSRVVISDTLLKFHDNDRRLSYLQQWQKNKAKVL